MADDLLTREEIVTEFRRRGISVAEWARARDLDYTVVMALLHGRTRGLRGESHKAAVALGMVREPKPEFDAVFAHPAKRPAGRPASSPLASKKPRRSGR